MLTRKAGLRSGAICLVLGLGALLVPPQPAGASAVITELRLGGVDGHLVIDVLSTEPLKYAQVESGSEPFTLTFYLLDGVLAFPAGTREVNEGPLKQVTASALQREESRLARLDLVFERLVPFRVTQDDKRLSVHLREPAIATRVVFRGSVSAGGEPAASPELPRATSAMPVSVALGVTPASATPPAPTPSPGASAPPAGTAWSPGSAGAPPAGPLPSIAPVSPRVDPPTPPPIPEPTTTLGSSLAAATPPTMLKAPRVPPVMGSPPSPSPSLVSSPTSQPGTSVESTLPGKPTPPAALVSPSPGAVATPSRRPASPVTTARLVPSSGAVPATRITRLAAAAGTADTQVRVQADGRLSYRTFTLSAPTRVVVDFEGVAYGLPEPGVTVDGPLVERVRAARFRSTPTQVVRVVFDLRKPAPYWVEPVEGGVVVHIGSAGPAP